MATLVVTTLVWVSGCSGSGEAAPDPPTSVDTSMRVTSTAFAEGASIPTRFSCDGDGVSPPLAWESVDEGQAYALVVDDPDAPGGTFVHWAVVDIAATTSAVAEGSAPVGGVELKNSSGEAAYAPMCPPSGTHHYRFTVYALSEPSGLAADASLRDAFDAVSSLATASGTLTATYSR